MTQTSSNLALVVRHQAPLAMIWVVGMVLVCGIFFAQTMNGRFGDEAGAQAAWDWLIGWITPGISVVLGGLAASASGLLDHAHHGARSLLLRIASIFSVVYLGGLLCVIVGVSFLDGGPFAAYRLANIPLGFAQSITLFTLTLFFARREQSSSRPGDLPDAVAAE